MKVFVMVSDRMMFVLWASEHPWVFRDHRLLARGSESWLWCGLPVAVHALAALLQREG